MQIEQHIWLQGEGWTEPLPSPGKTDTQLVLIFASPSVITERAPLEELVVAYPDALLVACSTAGEIAGTRVREGSLVATTIGFAGTEVQVFSLSPDEAPSSSDEVGVALGNLADRPDLVYLLALGDGTSLNGTGLVRGLCSVFGGRVAVTGGLAGDGMRFAKTHLFSGAEPRQDLAVGIGFYGDRLRVGHGSAGGWDPFGPERLITRSKGNVLYDLDGRSALGLYRKYLGEYARELPGTALLFPLAVRPTDQDEPVVRTVVAIDEENQSMTFAGDIIEGHYARLMKANFERLIDGATTAAKATTNLGAHEAPELAILISCVGRRLILGQRTEEEVEAARDIFGQATVLGGFYSYGEISPRSKFEPCEFHNQTMTITTLSEDD